MNSCPNCGAFLNDKCDYCGYISLTKDLPMEYSNLEITGDSNKIKIFNQKIVQKKVIVAGDSQILEVESNAVNIRISGDVNIVKIQKGVDYTLHSLGDCNEVKRF